MSKTDKELLMMAAKAADMGCTWLDDSDCMFWDGLPSMGIWNPLTDDGDALRLAVKLDMQVTIDLPEKYTWINHRNIDFVDEPHCSDPYAATRRAIVRTAAAVGEEM